MKLLDEFLPVSFCVLCLTWLPTFHVKCSRLPLEIKIQLDKKPTPHWYINTAENKAREKGWGYSINSTEREMRREIIWTGDSTLLDGEWETGSGLLIQSAHTHLDTQGHFSISSRIFWCVIFKILFLSFSFLFFENWWMWRDSCRSPMKWMQLPVTCIFHTTRTGVLCIVHITRFGHEKENFFYLCCFSFFSFC